MNWSGDFRQWPLGIKLTLPLWLPVFLVLATLFYTFFGVMYSINRVIDEAERRLPR